MKAKEVCGIAVVCQMSTSSAGTKRGKPGANQGSTCTTLPRWAVQQHAGAEPQRGGAEYMSVF